MKGKAMADGGRTQAERTAATRAALIAAARPLFAEHGYGAVSTEAVVRAAGVTRGALYHQFADKAELFAAVFEAVEADAMGRIDQRVAASGVEDPVELMLLGARAWLDVCAEPEVRRIALVDAPAVLGWERWRDIGMAYGFGMVQSLLELAMAMGRIRQQPVAALGHVLLGALDEAALYVALADDHDTARVEAGQAIECVIDGLAQPPAATEPPAAAAPARRAGSPAPRARRRPPTT